jgi:hypothetical protein
MSEDLELKVVHENVKLVNTLAYYDFVIYTINHIRGKKKIAKCFKKHLKSVVPQLSNYSACHIQLVCEGMIGTKMQQIMVASCS